MDVYARPASSTSTSPPTPRATRPASRSGRRGVAGDPEVLALARAAAGAEAAAEPGLRRRPLARRPRARSVRRAAAGRCSRDDGTDRGDHPRRGRPRPTRSAGWRRWCRRSRLVAGDGPLALLEVGAERRAVLYPDRYTYAGRPPTAYRRSGSGPELTCDVSGPAPLPGRAAGRRVARRRRPQPARRDRRRPDGVADHPGLARGRRPAGPAARGPIDVARTDPPRLVARRPARRSCRRLVDEAAAYGTVVVFHSAVIAYLDRRRPSPLPRADDRRWSPTVVATG